MTSTNRAFGRLGGPICSPCLPRQRRQRRRRRHPSHSEPARGPHDDPTAHVLVGPAAGPRCPASSVVDASRRTAPVSPSRAVDVRSDHRSVLSVGPRLWRHVGALRFASSCTCQRQQSPVLAGRLHRGVNLKGVVPTSAQAPTASRACRRTRARRSSDQHHPAPARTYRPGDHQHVSARNRSQRDHRRRPLPPPADHLRHRRTDPLTAEVCNRRPSSRRAARAAASASTRPSTRAGARAALPERR